MVLCNKTTVKWCYYMTAKAKYETKNYIKLEWKCGRMEE